MKRAIITGATGFIGSRLLEELIKTEYEVTVIARNQDEISERMRKHRNCTVIEGKIEGITVEQFDGNGYDVFFHLAWGGVDSERKNDVQLQLENISMSIKALELSNGIGCKKFVAAGTIVEYVLGDGIVRCCERQYPNDIYGAAKVSTFYFLDVRARQLNQDMNWIIIPGTYGPGQNSGVISYTIEKMITGEKTSYGPLSQIWDFLYVGEVARAIRMIAEKGHAGKVYGIGSGKPRVLLEYIEEIRDLIDPTLEIGVGKLPEKGNAGGGVYVDISELSKDTGFVPQIDFSEGIKATIQSMRNEMKR